MSQLTALAYVVSTEDGWATVQPIANSELCGRCAAGGGCLSWRLAVKGSTVSTRVRNTIAARPGDHVMLAIPARPVENHALFAFGLPLSGFFAGLLLAQSLHGGDGFSGGGAMAGLFAGWLVARYRLRRPQGEAPLGPMTMRRLETARPSCSVASNVSGTERGLP
ncbi:MAG: SoxR reducing system RseC family protein [Pseudomonadota bacterium]|nr:SoxR reducing system RseC family protein [Pseudomonadota bacterium]